MRSTFLITSRSRPPRTGFTLVELLMVIGIIVILLVMTVSAVNFSRNAERVSGAAGQIQSFLAGARDRAIYAKEARGVRFFLDPDNHRAVTTMVYIDPSEFWSDGVIQLQRWDVAEGNGAGNGQTDPRVPPLATPPAPSPPSTMDLNGDGIIGDEPTDIWIAAGTGTAWWELKRRGLLIDGLRIRIPKGPTGNWYTVNTSQIDVTVAPTNIQKLILMVPYRDPGDTPTDKAKAFENGGPETYELELPPRILPMDPVMLPQGVVIDLDGSKLPDAWRPGYAGGPVIDGHLQYSQFIDIVFSPRGNIVGTAASGGVIHLYVGDNEDSSTLKESFTLALANHPAAPGAPPLVRYTANGQDLPIAKVFTFNNLAYNGAASGVPLRFIPADEISSNNVTWLGGFTDEPFLTKDRRIVSIFTQTGGVTVHPIEAYDNYDPWDMDGDSNVNEPDGIADDPFFFAETGETAN